MHASGLTKRSSRKGRNERRLPMDRRKPGGALLRSPDPEPPPIPKAQAATDPPGRAKPEAVIPNRPAAPVQPTAPAVTEKAPEFLVTDLAGYSRSLNDFQGAVLIFGVWGSDQPKTFMNL